MGFNKTNVHWTPIQWASRRSFEISRLLIEKGADVNRQDDVFIFNRQSVFDLF